MSLTVQSGQVTGTLTDFPVLVATVAASWCTVANGGRIENIQGVLPADLAFFSDTACTVMLDFEIEEWDATTGQLTAWVKVPSVATGTVFYCGFGDVAQTTSPQDPPGVWTDNYAAVYHMPAVVGGEFKDSLATYNLSGSGLTATVGKIWRGGTFNGTSAYGTNAAAPDSAPPLTISGWAKTASLVNNTVLVSILKGGGVWNGFYISFETSPSDLIKFYTTSNDFATFGFASASFSAGGSFHQFYAQTSAVNARTIYINNVQGTPDTTSVTPTVTPDNITLGAFNNTHGIGGFLSGLLDEVRVHTVVRSDDYREADYNAQNVPTDFVHLGSEEPVGGGGFQAAWARLANVIIQRGRAAA